MNVLFAFLVASAAVAEPKESCESLRLHARFNVHFERVELSKLVQTVSDATCKTFIVGENLKGSISLVGPQNSTLTLDAEQFYAAFLAALDANGLTVFHQGRLLRIVEKPFARQFTPLLFEGAAFPSPNEVVTRVFKLQHAELEPTRALLAQLIRGGDLLVAAPDLLIATDVVSNLQRIEALLATLDVPRIGDVTRLISVKHADAVDLADKVNRLLAPRPGGRPSETLTIATDERTNRLLVVGSAALVERLEALVVQLDLEVPGDGKARVYRLKNADAKEVATALEGMTQNRGKPAAAPAAASLVGEVRITTNDALNALVIVASAGDYRSLVEVIEQLDVPIRQVFIETVIMEVNVQRDSELGLSFHGVAGSAETPVIFGSQPAGAPSSLSLSSLAGGSGLLAGVQGPVLTQVSKVLGFDVSSFGIALQAVQNDSDVNVMSTPYILTTDNKEAEITVGQRVPFQQGTNAAQLGQLVSSGNASTASTLANFGSSVTRERVELKLAVKPHIGDGDHIRLEINQSAEEIAGSNNLGPITSTRTQKTTVVAQDNQTLVLGGIMQDRIVESVSKTPVLGDIPVLGILFRNTIKKKTKVNLLVFLTPHIIRDSRDIDLLLERKMKERRRMLELLYGDSKAYEPIIDYAHRRGPLSAMFHAIDREQRRPENGGSGGPGDQLIAPVIE